jgi:molybdopterin-containing oxidoreductase family iron-sulfur binding subunit
VSQVEHHINGREYWQSLQQLANDVNAQEQAGNEFQGYDPDSLLTLSRRRFMQFMGGSMALAGLTLTGCRRYPEEKLAPYTARPAGRIPGVTAKYATAFELGGIGTGLLVSSYDGRPIKIEGNPSHPYSLGATDAIAQATVLDLYDPDRSRLPMDRSGADAKRSDWKAFQAFVDKHFSELAKAGGEGIAVLSESSSSETLAMMRERLQAKFPGSKWYEYEPINRDNAVAGSRLAFGEAVRPIYHLAEAGVVASFGCDLLTGHPAKLKHARDWSKTRKSADEGRMGRMYVAESIYTSTGTVADERIARSPHTIEKMLLTVANAIGVDGLPIGGVLDTAEQTFVSRVVGDLRAAGSRGLVVVGDNLSPRAHAVAHLINDKLQSVGTTVTYVADPAGDKPGLTESLANLVASVGEVSTLIILGGNPVYDAPVDIDFAGALSGVKTSIHLSEYYNETSAATTWHLPRAHFLESWGDTRAWDGTLSLVQPLIYPLYDGKTAVELLAMICGDRAADGYQLTRDALKRVLPATNFERHWRRTLHDGVAADSAYEAVTPSVTRPTVAALEDDSAGMTVVFQPSPAVYDGRFANNGWLQEMPDHLTKVTWDNPVLVSKADADRLKLTYGDMIALTIGDKTIEAAVYIVPGQAVGVLGLTLGYGRTVSGSIGQEVGFNMYAARTSTTLHSAPTATPVKLGRKYELATTQEHYLIDAVGMAGTAERVGDKHASGTIIRETTFAKYAADRGVLRKGEHGSVSLQLFEPPLKEKWEAKADELRKEGHPNPPTAFNDPHAWGMAIDMSVCMGCNACVVACQSENNIPIVGKAEVGRSREMHWLRIDRYFKGNPDDPSPAVVNQPMMCVHCENAPCEQVCPVAATVHDTEGLNTMVYNRCIGTRYCSNNCPYKVRRFNYFDWQSKAPREEAKHWLEMPDTQQRDAINDIKKMVFNPDVTVRMRGVMEKCSYCTQRINSVKIAKRNVGEAIKDGDVVTACQQVCPTEAIIFGDLNDSTSRVSKLQRENKRAYSVLGELNVRPRTQYLARITNPKEGD